MDDADDADNEYFILTSYAERRRIRRCRSNTKKQAGIKEHKPENHARAGNSYEGFFKAPRI